ncbi:MAG TPA: hypothetical protein VF472_15885 [Burkholderiaceae bacterium]
MRYITVLGGLALCMALAGCVAVEQRPTTFSPLGIDSGNPARIVRMERQVDIALATGYSRTLKQGGQWTAIGKVDAGEVFKPYNDIFTLEGSHIHEAYLVVSDKRLVGFYLPAEKTFSPLKPSIALPFN